MAQPPIIAFAFPPLATLEIKRDEFALRLKL
jgi:hypothetical protein